MLVLDAILLLLLLKPLYPVIHWLVFLLLDLAMTKPGSLHGAISPAITITAQILVKFLAIENLRHVTQSPSYQLRLSASRALNSTPDLPGVSSHCHQGRLIFAQENRDTIPGLNKFPRIIPKFGYL